MQNINFIQLDKEDFKKEISICFKQQLIEFSRNFSSNPQDELLTRKETADYLKINLTTLWHWTNKGKLISYSIGNRVYYKRSEIDSALIKVN